VVLRSGLGGYDGVVVAEFEPSSACRSTSPPASEGLRPQAQMWLRPCASWRTHPAPWRTFTCLDAQARLTANGAASWPTVWSPSARARSIASDESSRAVRGRRRSSAEIPLCREPLQIRFVPDPRLLLQGEQRLGLLQDERVRAALPPGDLRTASAHSSYVCPVWPQCREAAWLRISVASGVRPPSRALSLHQELAEWRNQPPSVLSWLLVRRPSRAPRRTRRLA
jgi:hypothetical protein